MSSIANEDSPPTSSSERILPANGNPTQPPILQSGSTLRPRLQCLISPPTPRLNSARAASSGSLVRRLWQRLVCQVPFHQSPLPFAIASRAARDLFQSRSADRMRLPIHVFFQPNPSQPRRLRTPDLRLGENLMSFCLP